MSVFRVKLQNVDQGRMDLDPSTNPLAAGTSKVYGDIGTPLATSKQRQVYVPGPDLVNRLLIDGETFTDSNYWKKFAYPQCDANEAFIEVVTDDGSTYSDVESENTYAVARSVASVGTNIDDLDQVVDFVTTYGGPARFLMIENTGAQDLVVELNGNTSFLFTIPAGNTQIFSRGDLTVTKIRYKSAAATTSVEIVASLQAFDNG